MKRRHEAAFGRRERLRLMKNALMTGAFSIAGWVAIVFIFLIVVVLVILATILTLRLQERPRLGTRKEPDVSISPPFWLKVHRNVINSCLAFISDLCRDRVFSNDTLVRLWKRQHPSKLLTEPLYNLV